LSERRIVSLLSSATEIAYALGAGNLLAGRSHECDYPPEVRALPVCTKPLIDVDGDSRAIDRQVKDSARNALSIYEVFDDVLERLQPTHILTQVQCDVCAVSLRDVEQSIAARLPSAPAIVPLNPASLADIWDDFRRVAEACGISAEPLIRTLKDRIPPISRTDRPTVACIEWIEPLMAAGNWMPELIDLAGGIDVFGKPGIHSPWITWDDLLACDPDVIIVAPCGFDLDRTRAEMRWLTGRPDFEKLRAARAGRFFLADGNRYFNRPGPRIVETYEAIREMLAVPGARPVCQSSALGVYSRYSDRVMAKHIIKGLAIAAGTGLAIGFGNKRNHPDIPAGGAVPESAPSEANLLHERLGGIESRLGALEVRPAPAAEAMPLAEIENRFDRRDREIAALRNQMKETRDTVSAVAAMIEDKFANIAKDVPGMVQAAVNSRVAELRSHLAAEIQESVDATLDGFERTVDNKISGRVAALEKALVDQSGIITALSQRALESDANLQRLISAVEKLCERAEGRPATPAAPAQPEDASFEKHLNDAAKRPPAASASGFRQSFVKEDEELRPRHRLSGYRG